jgi:hypothetical protein
MPVFKKIPLTEKEKGSYALGQYAIFTDSLFKAATIAAKLSKADNKKGIPAVGYVTHKGNKYYYCRYGFVNDAEIYQKP